jgi:hypothetical protein
MPLNKLIARNRDAIKEIARRYNASNIRVFGSMARGDAENNSDVDLLADLDVNTSLLDRIALIQEIEDLLGRKIDLVTVDKLHRVIKDRVIKEAIPL